MIFMEVHMIKLKKLATYCAIGTIALNSQSVVTKAEVTPVAGIDLLLSDFYEDEGNENKDIKAYLSSNEFKDYANISFADVTNYVNIRKKASENSKILGMLYNNSAATVLGKKGDWYKVKSGSVTGYVKADYLVTGKKAAALASKVGTRIATVNTTTLKVRKEASMDSEVLTLVPIGEELTVTKESDDWIKVVINNREKGYVSADYVDLTTVYEKAISIEEQKRLEAEKAARIKAENARKAISSSSSGNSSATSSNSTSQKKTSSNSNSYTASKSASSTASSQNTSGSSIRSKIVNYALQFEGNPYVWGGTSLTNGTDCSGFTQSVFRDMGISIPRDSRSQAAGGKTVSLSSIQPGDLIFYARGGTINHVALYIGNGKVISAKNSNLGIRINNYDYRTPVKAVSYLD